MYFQNTVHRCQIITIFQSFSIGNLAFISLMLRRNSCKLNVSNIQNPSQNSVHWVHFLKGHREPYLKIIANQNNRLQHCGEKYWLSPRSILPLFLGTQTHFSTSLALRGGHATTFLTKKQVDWCEPLLDVAYGSQQASVLLSFPLLPAGTSCNPASTKALIRMPETNDGMEWSFSAVWTSYLGMLISSLFFKPLLFIYPNKYQLPNSVWLLPQNKRGFLTLLNCSFMK